MAEFIALTCPSCNGSLQITDDVEQFACAYCGVEYLVRRGEGIVSLAPVVENLKEIRSGTDRAAAELAISRLKDEIADCEREIMRIKRCLEEKEHRKSVKHYFDEKQGFLMTMLKNASGKEDPNHISELYGLSSEDLDSLIAMFSQEWRWSNERRKRTLVLLQGIKQCEESIRDKQRQIRKYHQVVNR